MSIDPAWIALAGTVFGGIGLKAVEHWLSRNRVKIDDAAQIRDELRLEITAQREEIRQLEETVDKWRTEYYTLYKEYIAVQTSLTLALEKIKDELFVQQQKDNAAGKSTPPESKI